VSKTLLAWAMKRMQCSDTIFRCLFPRPGKRSTTRTWQHTFRAPIRVALSDRCEKQSLIAGWFIEGGKKQKKKVRNMSVQTATHIAQATLTVTV
jgi:hypothetical protein